MDAIGQYPTNLTFPTDVLKWMKANAKHRISLKLMQICKYFQHKEFPYFVIKKIYGDDEVWNYRTLDGQIYHNFVDISKPIWITDAITLMSSKVLPILLSKVVVCDIKILNLSIFSCLQWNEFKFLTASGKIEIFTLEATKILDAEGNQACLEELLKCLPNVKTLQM
uniref:Uncharacterized protein n=1 Tax=Panagrolaimus davidi TaxID=227884 RepID=A0A914P5E2_9BILA